MFAYQAKKEILVMTLREQLIKNISMLPETILYEVYEYVLFKANRMSRSRPGEQGGKMANDFELADDFDAGEATAAFEFLKKYKGRITREIDYKKEKLEYLDERYGAH
jgi:hypothetical protein